MPDDLEALFCEIDFGCKRSRLQCLTACPFL